MGLWNGKKHKKLPTPENYDDEEAVEMPKAETKNSKKTKKKVKKEEVEDEEFEDEEFGEEAEGDEDVSDEEEEPEGELEPDEDELPDIEPNIKASIPVVPQTRMIYISDSEAIRQMLTELQSLRIEISVLNNTINNEISKG